MVGVRLCPLPSPPLSGRLLHNGLRTRALLTVAATASEEEGGARFRSGLRASGLRVVSGRPSLPPPPWPGAGAPGVNTGGRGFARGAAPLPKGLAAASPRLLLSLPVPPPLLLPP